MFNQQMHEIMDELKDMEACKLPYKIEEFIPLFGMFIRDFRNSKQRPPLEDIVKKHGNFEIPDTFIETYSPIAAGYLSGWRGKNIRKNVLDGKYMLYQLSACSAPLIYGLLSW